MTKAFKFPLRYRNFAMKLATSNKEPYGDENKGWLKKETTRRKWTPTPGARRGMGGGYVMTSPCGKFILKYSFMAGGWDGRPDQVLPTRAVPTFFTAPGMSYQWLLQPICDISEEAINKADKALRGLSCKEKGGDSHQGNIGMLNGEAVVFDF